VLEHSEYPHPEHILALSAEIVELYSDRNIPCLQDRGEVEQATDHELEGVEELFCFRLAAEKFKEAIALVVVEGLSDVEEVGVGKFPASQDPTILFRTHGWQYTWRH
jgi:hypothetical protein